VKAVAELSPAGDFLRAKRMGRPPKVTTTPVNFSGVITKKVEVSE
jgi:hypothetical protein